jgi:hypothetical protein
MFGLVFSTPLRYLYRRLHYHIFKDSGRAETYADETVLTTSLVFYETWSILFNYGMLLHWGGISFVVGGFLALRWGKEGWFFVAAMLHLFVLVILELHDRQGLDSAPVLT